MPEDTLQEEQALSPEDFLRTEIEQRLKSARAFYKDWNEAAQEDYKFALGDQWTEEERNKLQKQSRPALTFNRIRPLINLVSGYQRENSARIKVNPEGGEDHVFSSVMDKGLKTVDKWGKMNYKLGYQFDDGLYCGKGFIETVIEYDKDPIRGRLGFKQRSPYQILPDPECLEYDMNEGAEYCFKIVRLTKGRLMELYPDHADLINGFVVDNDSREDNAGGIMKEGSDDDYGNRPNVTTVPSSAAQGDPSTLEKDGKFTVKEYWRKKMVSKWFVINKEDGEPERFDNEEDALKFAADQGEGFEPVERKVPEMWVAAFVAGFILQDELSPFEPYYSGFPFFRYLADWIPNAPNELLRTQGITRPLKDPQREKNKSKSQYLHILNTQSNSGWIGDKNALSNTGWQLLEQMGSKPGITVKKKPGSDLREIQPKNPATSHVLREQKADEEFTQISGIDPTLLGIQDAKESGRALSIRVRQAILGLVRLFINYKYTKEIIGVFILQMMPALFDAKKLMKVLGPSFMQKIAESDPDKYPDGFGEGHIKAFLQLVKDHKYDVLVTEADQNSTMRFEIFQELTELLKAGAPIPMQLILDYMDMPNKEEVKKAIQEEAARIQEQLANK